MSYRNHITLVCSFGRAGSSLTMRMLEAGGVPPFAENRQSYEHHAVQSLPRSTAWLQGCIGKAVKLLDPQIFTPPAGLPYLPIWIGRDSFQQAKSMAKFAAALRMPMGPTNAGGLKRLARSFVRDRPKAIKAIRQFAGRDPLELSFEQVIKDPALAAQQINQYLGGDLNVAAMAECVIPRGTDCLPYLLELQELGRA